MNHNVEMPHKNKFFPHVYPNANTRTHTHTHALIFLRAFLFSDVFIVWCIFCMAVI